MGYEAHAPSFLFLLVAAAVANLEELREEAERWMKKVRAKLVR